MMMRMKTLMMLFLMPTALMFVGAGCANLTKMATMDIPRMEPEELLSRMKDPNITVIDIRLVRDWEESSRKIKGAHREISDDFSTWESKYAKDKTVVLYCA